jgi:hypothetical protein
VVVGVSPVTEIFFPETPLSVEGVYVPPLRSVMLYEYDKAPREVHVTSKLVGDTDDAVSTGTEGSIIIAKDMGQYEPFALTAKAATLYSSPDVSPVKLTD